MLRIDEDVHIVKLRKSGEKVLEMVRAEEHQADALDFMSQVVAQEEWPLLTINESVFSSGEAFENNSYLISQSS